MTCLRCGKDTATRIGTTPTSAWAHCTACGYAFPVPLVERQT